MEGIKVKTEIMSLKSRMQEKRLLRFVKMSFLQLGKIKTFIDVLVEIFNVG